MSRRIGIFGGTFDPIHYGHLAIAEEARVGMQLDQMLFMPAARQPFKQAGHIASPAQRLAMVQLACQSNPAFRVSTLELERHGPSYTVTTLEALHESQPDELYFILGADALIELPRWHQAARVVALAQIIAVGRPGYAPDLPSLQHALPELRDRLHVLIGPQLDISSTLLRERVATRQPIRYQTPDAVSDYIVSHGLYHG